ncbi:MAG: DUF2804 domain-containing protein [Clostridia bacterium]|nr:DUF2804 domain-containing protein [Clostridia bacterium]
MQREITKASDLHDDTGRLMQVGWAKDLLLRYDRRRIKASGLRIKEWDYYCVLSDSFGVAFTVADIGFMGTASASYLDFDRPYNVTKTVTTAFPLGRFNMPPTSTDGDVVFENKAAKVRFEKDGQRRVIDADFPNFDHGRSLIAHIELTQPDPSDSMAIVTPFAGAPRAFYYNQKINCMPAQGRITIGSEERVFEARKAFGVLDWGRGVWTYSNTWYWGSASGVLDGEPFGFNIGYGFGDTSAASENMIFYKNKAHKLDQVEFLIPHDDYLAPWTFTSNDHRFEMDFLPIVDRFASTNAVFIESTQHQVFGRFTGKAVLDDGAVLQVADFLGFAEKVRNRW